MEQGDEHAQIEALKEQIAKARATALSKEELGKVLHKEAELNSLFLRGKISGEELKSTLKALNRHAGVVKATDPDEYRRILALIGLSEEAIQKFMNDELPHYEKAREQHLRALLRVQFFTMGDEQWGLCAQTEVIYPDDLADELFKEAHRQTLEAPGEENLSPLDRKGLGLDEKKAG